MTITEHNPRTNFELVTVDLYRDIHKAIRTELFGITATIGSLDPNAQAQRLAAAARVHEAVALLVTHAEHEDTSVQPAIEVHVPSLAERIAVDHLTLESRMQTLTDMADASAFATADHAGIVHRLYLEFASFTSAYLEHQDLEERVIMPALEAAIGFEAVLAIHQQIVGSIPPDEMARSLALMLPAMNVENRTELLGGMKAGAPPEVFEGVWGLAQSVLAPADFDAVEARLGLS